MMGFFILITSRPTHIIFKSYRIKTHKQLQTVYEYSSNPNVQFSFTNIKYKSCLLVGTCVGSSILQANQKQYQTIPCQKRDAELTLNTRLKTKTYLPRGLSRSAISSSYLKH